MAGTSMNDIKGRIKSVTSTMQITKAMELVATSKLRRAREIIDASRPFHEIIGKAIDSIESSSEIKDTIWSRPTEANNPLYIVIAGDRGLAGGYNSNIFRLSAALSGDKKATFLPLGRKAYDYFAHRKMKVYTSDTIYVSEMGVSGCLDFAQSICQSFLDGEYDSVVLVYTKFASMISQVPVYEQLLPLERERSDDSYVPDPIYGGDPEEILEKIVPQYVGGVLYSAVCEALASESGARRTAMNAANKNASEMIDTLMLKYNRARQAVITQEITEIVSGAEAL